MPAGGVMSAAADPTRNALLSAAPEVTAGGPASTSTAMTPIQLDHFDLMLYSSLVAVFRPGAARPWSIGPRPCIIREDNRGSDGRQSSGRADSEADVIPARAATGCKILATIA
jgi:hypothetical protein